MLISIYAQHTIQSDLSHQNLYFLLLHIYTHTRLHTLQHLFFFYIRNSIWLLFSFSYLSAPPLQTQTHHAHIYTTHYVAVLTFQPYLISSFTPFFFLHLIIHTSPPFSVYIFFLFLSYAFLFLSFGKLTSTSFICYCLYETYYIPPPLQITVLSPPSLIVWRPIASRS